MSVILILVATISCSKASPDGLRFWVAHFCHDRENELAVSIPGVAHGQSINLLGDVSHNEVGIGAYRDFNLCANARQIDDAQRDSASQEFEDAVGELVLPGNDAAAYARALTKMDELYQRVNAWPLL